MVLPAANVWIHHKGIDLDVASLFDPFGQRGDCRRDRQGCLDAGQMPRTFDDLKLASRNPARSDDAFDADP